MSKTIVTLFSLFFINILPFNLCANTMPTDNQIKALREAKSVKFIISQSYHGIEFTIPFEDKLKQLFGLTGLEILDKDEKADITVKIKSSGHSISRTYKRGALTRRAATGAKIKIQLLIEARKTPSFKKTYFNQTPPAQSIPFNYQGTSKDEIGAAFLDIDFFERFTAILIKIYGVDFILNAFPKDQSKDKKWLEKYRENEWIVKCICAAYKDSGINEKVSDYKTIVKLYDALKLKGDRSASCSWMLTLITQKREPFSNIRNSILKSGSNQNILHDLATNDPDWRIRKEAILKINDQKILKAIVKHDSKYLVRESALRKIDDEAFLIELAKNDDDQMIRRDTVDKIKDQDILISIAKNDEDGSVRFNAIKKIRDIKTLKEIFDNDPRDINRDCITKQIKILSISDHNEIISIAKNDPDLLVREYAVNGISDQEILADISINDSSWVSRVAIKRISDQNILLQVIEAVPANSDWKWKLAIEFLTDKNIFMKVINNNKLDIHKRTYAVDLLNDQKLLHEIVMNNENSDVRKAAIYEIFDQDVLKQVITNDRSEDVRNAAMKRINELQKGIEAITIYKKEMN